MIEQKVYQPKAVLEMIPYLINLKEASGNACEIWLKLCHIWGYFMIWQIFKLCKHGWAIMQRVTTRVAVRITIHFLWDLPNFGLFATRYHALPLIFWKKVVYIYFFINLTVTRGNRFQIAQNQEKLRKSRKKFFFLWGSE